MEINPWSITTWFFASWLDRLAPHWVDIVISPEFILAVIIFPLRSRTGHNYTRDVPRKEVAVNLHRKNYAINYFLLIASLKKKKDAIESVLRLAFVRPDIKNWYKVQLNNYIRLTRKLSKAWLP